MFFFFPFGFLIPIVLVLLAVKFGSRVFRDIFHELDNPGQWRRDLSGRSFRRDALRSRLRRPQGMEARIFRLAYKLKGRITISDIVLETDLSVREAEEAANKMVDGLRVTMEIDDRGLVVYEFPEIISRFNRS
jgi:hypothetical protein